MRSALGFFLLILFASCNDPLPPAYLEAPQKIRFELKHYGNVSGISTTTRKDTLNLSEDIGIEYSIYAEDQRSVKVTANWYSPSETDPYNWQNTVSNSSYKDPGILYSESYGNTKEYTGDYVLELRADDNLLYRKHFWITND